MNDLSTCGLVVLIAVGALIWLGGWFLERLDARAREEEYRDALRDRGDTRVRMGRRAEDDVIELPREIPALVRFYHTFRGAGRTRRRIDYTEYIAKPPRRDGALRVTTQEWHDPHAHFYGTRDVTVGDEPFDGRFLVHGRDEAVARRFLDEPTRRRLERLSGMGTGGFLFEFRPGEALVRVGMHVRDGRAMRAFVLECEALVDRVIGETVGVHAEGVAETGEGVCLVCGAKIEGASVACAKCRTPHHADCWTYNDGCAIFACGGRRKA